MILSRLINKSSAIALFSVAFAVVFASALKAQDYSANIVVENDRSAKTANLHLYFSYDQNDSLYKTLNTKIDDFAGAEENVSVVPHPYIGFADEHRTKTYSPRDSFLERSFADADLKAILALEESAVDLVEDNINLVPRQIPIILGARASAPEKILAVHKNSAMLFLPDTAVFTVRFALDLFPNTKRLFVLTDLSPRGDYVSVNIKKLREEFPHLKIIEVEREKTSTAEMFNIVKQAGAGDVVMFCSWHHEGETAEYAHMRIAKELARITKAPIMSPYRDIAILPNILGGEVIDADYLSNAAMKLIRKSVKSGSLSEADNMGVASERIINYPSLARNGLRVADVPAGVTLRNIPPSFIDSYGSAMMYFLASLFVFAFVVAVLIVSVIKVRRQRNLLNSILRQTPISLFLTDATGKIIMAFSDEKLGVERPVGKRITQVMGVFDGIVDDIEDFLLSGDDMRSGEWSFTLPNGFKKWRNINFLKLDRSIAHKNIKFAFLSRDITQTRQLRDFIASELSMRNRILESTVNAIVVVNGEGKISFINQRAALLRGKTPKFFIGKSMSEFLSGMVGEDGANISPICETSLRENKVFSLNSVKVPIPSGGHHTIDAYIAPIKMADGINAGVIITCRDVTEIARAKNRLEYVKQFVQNAVKTMQAYYFMYDIRTGKYIPECTSDELKKSPEDPTPHFYEDEILPEDRDPLFSKYAELIEGKLNHLDMNFRRFKDGKMEYYTFHADRTKSAEGEDIISGIVLNYTKTRESQDELSEARGLLDNIFMYSPFGISLKDVDDNGRYILWNKALEHLTGITSKEAVGHTFGDLYPEETEDMSNVEALTLERGSYTSDVVKRKSRIDGKTRYFSFKKIALKTLTGKRMIMTLFENATDIVRSEYEKNEIIENIPEAIALFDVTKKVLYANRHAAEITKVPHDMLIGSYCNGTFCHEAHGHFCTTLEAAVTGIRHSAVKTINGRIYNVVSSPILDDNKNVQKIVMTLTDITEDEQNKHKLSAALKKANAAAIAKSAFLSTMSHEIRTPLNVIIGSSELLNLEELPQSAAESAKAIYVASVALSQIINNVLDYSKLDAGRMEVIFRKTRMESIVTDMEKLFRANAESKGIGFSTEVSGEMPPLMLDSQHIRQVLMNLISNAIKFTEKGGVKLSVDFLKKTDDTGELKLCVEDTGMGISKEKQTAVFMPFEREISRNRIQGTGLGLAISLLLTKLLHGTINLNSEVGKGAKFTVSLPNIKIADSFPAENAPNIETGIAKFKPATVLVVDDIPMNRKVLCKILQKLNLRFLEAESADEAMKTLLSGAKVDLVITDLWMPQKSGADLMNEISADPELSKIPTYLLTADTEMKVNFSVEKFKGIILKPVSIKSISHSLMSSLPTQ